MCGPGRIRCSKDPCTPFTVAVTMRVMTFEDFQATRRPCDDLPAALDCAPWGDGPAPPRGFLYLDGFFIEEVTEVWPDEASAAGKYRLPIARAEWFSDDLADLERRLFEFAKAEGYVRT